MTQFNKSQFINSGGYVSYCMVPMPCPWADRKFVARFKYTRGSAASFITFLIKNFTVEEYFGRLEAGESPLPIVESKGYLQPHVKKAMKAAGLAPIAANKAAYMAIYSAELDAMCARVKREQAQRAALKLGTTMVDVTPKSPLMFNPRS